MTAPGKQSWPAVILHNPDRMKKTAEKAYSLWEKRGRPHGSDMQDWIEAEWFIMGVEKGKAACGGAPCMYSMTENGTRWSV